MIDTIRFKIPVTKKLEEVIKTKSIETKKIDHKINFEVFSISNTPLPLKSYDRHINIFSNYQGFIFIEFSIPKFLYGHNVYLCYPDSINSALYKLKSVIMDYFEVSKFPDLEEWEVVRLDACYAWKFKNEEECIKVMRILQLLDYPRKDKYVYSDESVMFKASTYTIKFYRKYDEFYSHDFKHLKYYNYTDIAYKFLDIAKGVLRYEITMRSKYLKSCLGSDKPINIFRIPPDFYEKILQNTMITLFQGFDPSMQKKDRVFSRLITVYGKRKASSLFMFYYFLINEGKKVTREKYRDLSGGYSQYYYKVKQLRDAGVSITSQIAGVDHFNLSIPSEYVVNNKEFASGDSRRK